MNPIERNRAVELRKEGRTYPEISRILGRKIPRSTLSYWCSKTVLPRRSADRVRSITVRNLKRGREIALENRRRMNKKREAQFDLTNKRLFSRFKSDLEFKKIALVMLYLAEGSKTRRGSLMFGNSSPMIVRLFLRLMREIYKIDEQKFRVTVQCRADQNVTELQRFWSEITGVPLLQFYAARIDPRSIGKTSRKQDYKGVCRIDYFSAQIDNELLHIANKIDTL